MTTIATNPVPPNQRTVAMLLDLIATIPRTRQDSVPDIPERTGVGAMVPRSQFVSAKAGPIARWKLVGR